MSKRISVSRSTRTPRGRHEVGGRELAEESDCLRCIDGPKAEVGLEIPNLDPADS